MNTALIVNFWFWLAIGDECFPITIVYILPYNVVVHALTEHFPKCFKPYINGMLAWCALQESYLTTLGSDGSLAVEVRSFYSTLYIRLHDALFYSTQNVQKLTSVTPKWLLGDS